MSLRALLQASLREAEAARGEGSPAEAVGRILELAAHAEQRLAEQEARIRYLETLSLTDDLTGLLNRRGFRMALEKALKESGQTNANGVLAICDIDDFKAINDRYGHPVGDAALCHLAGHLRCGLRAGDAVARLGGDEFALVLCGYDVEGIEKRVYTLAERLAETPLLIEEAQGTQLRLTLSITVGLARFDAAATQDELIQIADAAFYQRKAGDKAAGVAGTARTVGR